MQYNYVTCSTFVFLGTKNAIFSVINFVFSNRENLQNNKCKNNQCYFVEFTITCTNDHFTEH